MQGLCFLLLLLISASGHAECSCLWRGSFAEVQAGASLVVSGTVTARKGNAIDLAIGQPLRGTPPRQDIRIWLKAADYCRPEAALFPPHSQWVMALQRIDHDIPGGFNPGTPNISYGRIGDYVLSSCGGYWLRLEGEWVTGNLVEAPRWERQPKMTPVLLELVAAYVRGEADATALAQASRVDPALQKLRLDTRGFLRDQR